MFEKIINLFHKREKSEKKTEHCVICHRAVDISRDMPVEQRKNYYEGVGQICDNCWDMIYGSGAGFQVWMTGRK
ncbi:MAG: hypothetical protein IJ682_03685 [Lachnospiraceae bacterium]|nr:hypothetical protein [Lachnospiraceae bacterium]